MAHQQRPWDYDEENRRVIVEEAYVAKDPRKACEKCPACDHVSLVRLCFYFWSDKQREGDGSPASSTFADTAAALTGAPHGSGCDIWICFVCHARVRDELVVVPTEHDLTLEGFKDEHARRYGS